MVNEYRYPIIAASGFARVVPENEELTPLLDLRQSPVNLEEAFFNVFQNKVRRASRYVKFANLAAHHCLKEMKEAGLTHKKIGLFLGTGLGNCPDIVSFTAEIFANHETTVSPGSFVNTVSNAGLFYAARLFGVECTTSVVSQETLSFETALLSAVVALQAGEVEIALVGGVDVFLGPKETMYDRLSSKVANSGKLGEGATFIALSNELLSTSAPIGFLKKVIVERVEKDCSNSQWIKERCNDLKAVHPLMALGLDMFENTLSDEAKTVEGYPYFSRQFTGNYSTGSAFVAAKFLLENLKNGAKELVHFNRHEEGLAGIIHLEKGQP